VLCALRRSPRLSAQSVGQSAREDCAVEHRAARPEGPPVSPRPPHAGVRVDVSSSERLPTAPLEALVAAGYSRDPAFTTDNVVRWNLAREGELLWSGGEEGDDDVCALAIPEVGDLRVECIKRCHDSPFGGHFGLTKTLHLLKRSFWWPGMADQTKEFIRCCKVCQEIKSNNQPPAGELSPLPTPTCRWESLSMDFIVKLPATERGNDAILVVVDRFSKYVVLEPCSENMTSPELVATLKRKVIAEKGYPRQIVADRDVRITAVAFTEWAKEFGIELRLNTSYHSRANGQAERMNLVVENYLRAFVDAGMSNWDELLPVCQLTINNSYHSSVDNTPFYLEYGRHPYIPGITTFKRAGVSRAEVATIRRQWPESFKNALLHARETMKKATERAKRHFDTKRKVVEFDVGDRILLSTKNLKLKGVSCVKLGA
jgi:transposase InsO family protein